MVPDSLCTSRPRKTVEGATSDRTTVRGDADMGWSSERGDTQAGRRRLWFLQVALLS